MKYCQIFKVLRGLLILASAALLSGCFIEGGGCSGPFCFGVSTEICSNGLVCDDEQAYRCPDLDDIEAESTLAINRIRSSASSCSVTGDAARNLISWNDQLFATADAQSRDMATNNFISALGSDGLGVDDRLADLGGVYVSQSVAGGFFTVDELFSNWASDSRECSQINSEQASSFALACRYDDDSQYGSYWTLVMSGQ